MLSAISYLSILFAPFLLPLIVYFITKDEEVKYHSKRAFLSHLIPTVFGIILSIAGVFGFISINSDGVNSFVIVFVIFMVLYFIMTIILLIWNIIQAVRVLRVKEVYYLSNINVGFGFDVYYHKSRIFY